MMRKSEPTIPVPVQTLRVWHTWTKRDEWVTEFRQNMNDTIALLLEKNVSTKRQNVDTSGEHVDDVDRSFQTYVENPVTRSELESVLKMAFKEHEEAWHGRPRGVAWSSDKDGKVTMW